MPQVVSLAAQYNVIGEDPQLIDPENGDYSVTAGSMAEDYGCQIFPPKGRIPKRTIKQLYFKGYKLKNKGTIEISEDIISNTLWNADTVKVLDNISIIDGAVLTIGSGTVIQFDDFYHLDVEGSLQALGEADEKIIFTSKKPQDFAVDHSTSGAWNGLKFNNTSSLNPVSIFRYCRFEYSKSFGTTNKGGVICDYGVSNLKLINCVFTNNVADYGSAISIEYQAAPKIFGCLFYDNVAFIGGSPIFCSYSYPNITNNTFVDNVVLNTDTYYKTGALQTFISKPKISNNIFWENTSNYFTSEQLIECKGYYTTYNDIEGGHPGKGNIAENPMFEVGGDYTYYLSDNSICIDRGSPDTVLSIFSYDLIGNLRILQAKIDIGCYEWKEPISIFPLPNNSMLELKNYPNPAHDRVTFDIYLSQDLQRNKITGNTKIKIYNIKGRLVKILQMSMINNENGLISVIWNGNDYKGNPVKSGVYFYRLFFNNIAYAHNKLIWIK